MKNTDFVTKWVLEKAKTDYKDDIALVAAHSTLRIDDKETCIAYFVPKTDKGRSFAQTFILEGMGFDIWAIEWERLEKFADLEEYNITILADAELLYAADDAAAKRFSELKERQRKNLKDPFIMRKKSLEAYARAKSIYSEMLFSEDYDKKMSAGYIADYLAQAIVFTNSEYFRKSGFKQLDELSVMKKAPEGFAELYRKVLLEKSIEKQEKLCREMISMVKIFLEGEAGKESDDEPKDFQLLSDWYGELSYEWLRLRTYRDRGEFITLYMRGCYLQDELNYVCDEFGLKKFELMNYFDTDNIDIFIKRADEIEGKIRQIITDHGAKINEYSSQEEFLNEVQEG